MERTSIQVFQDLILVGDKRAIRDGLLSAKDKRWRHAVDQEETIRKYSAGESDVITFDADDQGAELPGCTLTLFGSADGYRVTNIVPSSLSELDYETYNRLLRDFASRVVEPTIRDKGISLQFTDERRTPSELLGQNAAAALHRFSVTANKSTGIAHPIDRERWFDFIVAAHEEELAVSADLLARLLQEVERWPVDVAGDLAGEYETAIALLSYYDNHRSF